MPDAEELVDWTARVRDAFAGAPDQPAPDVVEELADHLSAMDRAARADGCSHDEAVRRVDAQLALWKRDAASLRRPVRRQPAVEPPHAAPDEVLAAIVRDVRHAARLLARQPRFTTLAIVTMAVGIGVWAVLFSVTWGVLMKPLPWPEAERLVVLKETRGGLSPRFLSFSNASYLAWRDEPRTLDGIAAWTTRLVTLSGAGDADRIDVTAGTASLFRVLRIIPLAGALFDDAADGARVVVLSEGLWRRRFGGDPAAVGRSVSLDGVPHTIVGVAADGVSFPDHRSQAWIPLEVRSVSGNALSMFHVVARLRDGIDPAQAAAEGTARGRFVPDTGLTTRAIFGGDGPVEISATPLHAALTAEVRRPLFVLLGAVALLLVLATSNVASLQLARAVVRRRELAVRMALGARRSQLLRQLATESLLVALAGGAAGLGLAWMAHRLLPTMLPADFPRAGAVSLDWTVGAVALAATVVSGLACGVVPARRALRGDLVAALSSGVSPAGAGGRSGPARARLLIVATQVAIACVLLVGASLLGRTFAALVSADRGFDPASVLSARLSMAGPTYTMARRHAMLSGIVERLSAAPGIRAAAFTSEQPLSPGGSTSAFDLPTRAGATIAVQASPRLVSAGYFAALGVRIMDGRPFAASDTATSQPVAVVNETFARRFLQGDAVGARVPAGVWGGGDGPGEATVIGVSEDVRYVGAPERTQPEMYFLLEQVGARAPLAVATVLLRADEPRAATSWLRRVIRDADAGLAADAVMTLDERLRSSLVRPRLYAAVLGSFALCAAVITGVGLFAVLSYVFTQRTRELGIRAALGARSSDLVRLVIRQALAVAAGGVAAGLLVSLVAARALGALLYGVTPYDAVTYIVAGATLLLIAALACAGPAYRAARLDPVRAIGRV